MRQKLILVLFLSVTTTSLFAWNWTMPSNKYKIMDTFQRAQYNKGVRLYNQRQYRAAAIAFEKFSVNFEDSPVLPYIIFMQAYCLHTAKDRNKAIKTYNKVLDFFGEEIYAAAPSLYYLGSANIDNGDIKKGMLFMKEMVEDVDYNKHPLAASALHKLAENYWKNKDYNMAVQYWKKIIAKFSVSNPGEARYASNSIANYYIKNCMFSKYKTWYIKEQEKKSPKEKNKLVFQLRAVENAYNIAWGYYSRWFSRYQKKEKKKFIKLFMVYFKAQKPVYEKSNAMWTYYYRSISLLTRFFTHDQDSLKKEVMNALQLIAGMKDKSKNDGKYLALTKILRQNKQFDLAQYVINKMINRIRALWEEYYIIKDKRAWKNAIAKLLEIEKRGSDKDRISSKWQQAWVYQYYLGQYDNAIKVYRDLAQPPKTLWEIQSCYFKKGDLKNTLIILSELEGSFPKDAPEAAFRKAYCYRAVRENKKAVAAARKVLKKYPKSRAASKAHELLEDFGVATGGGTINED